MDGLDRCSYWSRLTLPLRADRPRPTIAPSLKVLACARPKLSPPGRRAAWPSIRRPPSPHSSGVEQDAVLGNGFVVLSALGRAIRLRREKLGLEQQTIALDADIESSRSMTLPPQLNR
jgi:hypothetical protein